MNINIKSLSKNYEFNKKVLFLRRSSKWSKKKHRAYQFFELIKLLKYASTNIPFYINYFKKKKLSISDFKSLNDLKNLPIIDKHIINKNKNKFLPINFERKKFFHRTTGGSTGHPLTIWYDKNFLIKDKANTLYYLKIFGLNFFNYKNIRIYGDKIEKKIKKKIFWTKINKKKILMSAYHINEQNIKFYVEKINSFNPIYLHSRSSIVYLLAKLIRDKNFNISSKIKYIFVDGEYLTLGQRKLIENIFKTRVVNIYGHTEGAVVGHPCLHHNYMHFMPQNGWIEFLDHKNKPIQNKAKKAKMIVTGFNNYVMPIIRYDTNDYCIISTKKTNCKCFRGYNLVKEVEGRIQDYVFDKKKNPIPLAPAIFNYNDMDWKGFGEFRVIQKEYGKLIFEVASKKNIILKKFLKKKIKMIFGQKFQIKIIFVKKISRTKIGKFRYLKQHLNFKKI